MEEKRTEEKKISSHWVTSNSIFLEILDKY
jgi:hypothetical protein